MQQDGESLMNKVVQLRGINDLVTLHEQECYYTEYVINAYDQITVVLVFSTTIL